MTQRNLASIAAEIYRDWGSKINYAARPHLQAMREMDNIADNYGYDSGKSVVLYFLSNASTWRGDTAKRIKAELKAMCK